MRQKIKRTKPRQETSYHNNVSILNRFRFFCIINKDIPKRWGVELAAAATIFSWETLKSESKRGSNVIKKVTTCFRARVLKSGEVLVPWAGWLLEPPGSKVAGQIALGSLGCSMLKLCERQDVQKKLAMCGLIKMESGTQTHTQTRVLYNIVTKNN